MVSVKKKAHGTLIALREGIKISSDGIVDPTDNADNALQGRGLGFVFGSMPQGETREARFKEQHSYIKHIFSVTKHANK